MNNKQSTINNKISGKLIFFFFLFLTLSFAGGYLVGNSSAEQGAPLGITKQASEPEQVDLSLFWQVWGLLQKKHLKRPLESTDMLYGAIKGLAESTGDPYTTFLPPEENDLMKASLEGEYEGIGAELGMRDEQLIIVAPLDGSPALSAGVKAGDKIIKVDGEETTAWSVTEAVSKIRGEAGTNVTLTMLRSVGDQDGLKTVEITITRGTIDLPSITWEKKEGVYYIRLSRFGEATNSEWDTAVKEIINNNGGAAPGKIILDLRGNPGGYLDAAIHIASDFISGGTIVFEQFGDGRKIPFADRYSSELVNSDPVILIDGGSASASEIVAAALRERRNAVLVGKQSFGKGTVQDSKDLANGSGLHITVAKWLTPEGNCVNEVGLEPDYIVDYTQEDSEADRDPQLEKAIELVKSPN